MIFNLKSHSDFTMGYFSQDLNQNEMVVGKSYINFALSPPSFIFSIINKVKKSFKPFEKFFQIADWWVST